MHLCVSSKYLEVYNMSCQLVEELLNNLYREYDSYCRKTGRRYQGMLKIKRIEAFGGNQPKLNPEVKSPETNKENYVNKMKGNLWASLESAEFQDRVGDFNFNQFGDLTKEKGMPKYNDEDLWKILKLRGINVHDDKKAKAKLNEISDKIISPYEDNI
jgi:hypothetical protein